MPVLDCHVHLNNYNEFNKSEKKILSLEERVNALLESMYNNDIDYSIILSSYKVDIDRPSTYQIIDTTKKYNDKLGVVAGFSIDNHTNEDLENYRKWLKDGYIKG
ncbi:MAG: amidohydrolase, partial [Nitrososphaeraceae archaeon]